MAQTSSSNGIMDGLTDFLIACGLIPASYTASATTGVKNTAYTDEEMVTIALSNLENNLKFPSTLQLYGVYAFDQDGYRVVELEYGAMNNKSEMMRNYYVAIVDDDGSVYKVGSSKMHNQFYVSNVVKVR